MGLPTPPDGLNRQQMMEWINLEISSNLYDEVDLAALQAKLIATRDAPQSLQEQGIETETE
jgi:hypothetical protein